jgi:hypothetical protein
MSNWMQFPQAQASIADSWERQWKLVNEIVVFVAEMCRQHRQVEMDHLGRIILHEFPHPNSLLVPTLLDFSMLSSRKQFQLLMKVCHQLIEPLAVSYRPFQIYHPDKNVRQSRDWQMLTNLVTVTLNIAYSVAY